MTKEQCKQLVEQIFGKEASEDDDIVDFYFMGNKTAMEEYAREQAIAFAKWVLDTNGGLKHIKEYKIDLEQLYQLFLNQSKQQ